MKALKQKLKDILAQAKGTRWDVVACRACGILSITAGLGQYAGFIPGRTGAIVAGVSGGAAALLPRATKAAGLLTAAYNQKTPFLKVLPAIVSTLLAGPAIIAEAKAADQTQAEAEKQKAVAAQIDQAVEQKMADLKITNLTLDDLKNLTGEFARADLAKKATDVPGEKTTNVSEPTAEPKAAPEPPVGAQTSLSSQTGLSAPGAAPTAASDPAIRLVGGNQ